MQRKHVPVFLACALALCSTGESLAAQRSNSPKVSDAQRMVQIEHSPAFLRAVEIRKAQLDDMRVVAASGLLALTGQMRDIVGAQFVTGGISQLAGEYGAGRTKPTRTQAEASLRNVALAQGVLESAGLYSLTSAQEDNELPGFGDALKFWCTHKPQDTYRLCASYAAWLDKPELPPVMETASGDEDAVQDPFLPAEQPSFITLGRPAKRTANRPTTDVLNDLNAATAYIPMAESYVEDIAKFGTEMQIRAAKPISPVVMDDVFLKRTDATDRAWADPAASLKNLQLVWENLAKVYVKSDADIVGLCQGIVNPDVRRSYCATYMNWRKRIRADGVYLGGYEDALHPVATRATSGTRTSCTSASCLPH